MNKYIVTVLVSITFCFSFHASFSQKNILKQEMIWGTYSLKMQASPKVTLGLAHEERYLRPFRIHHRLTTVGIGYQLNSNWTIGQDYLQFYFYFPQDGALDVAVTVPELRPRQVITHTPKPLGKAKFTHRFMIEERFIHKRTETELVDGYNFNVRFRYKFGASIPLIYSKGAEDKQTKLSFNPSAEFMLNAGKIIENTFNQSRLIAGLAYHFNPNLTLSASYIHWYLQRNVGSNFVRWDIFHLSLSHKLKLYKE